MPCFHGDRVLQAFKSCELIADIPDGGHGALLSPLPPGLTGILGDMLNDPPGFDRSQLPAADRQTSSFFTRHLVNADASPRPNLGSRGCDLGRSQAARCASIALCAADLCVPTAAGTLSGALVPMRPAASGRRVHDSVCR